MPPSATLTADELQRLNLPNKRTELVRGMLVVQEPAGYRHGEVAARLTNRLMNHVNAHDLGRVLAAATGFKLAANPDTDRVRQDLLDYCQRDTWAMVRLVEVLRELARVC